MVNRKLQVATQKLQVATQELIVRDIPDLSRLDEKSEVFIGSGRSTVQVYAKQGQSDDMQAIISNSCPLKTTPIRSNHSFVESYDTAPSNDDQDVSHVRRYKLGYFFRTKRTYYHRSLMSAMMLRLGSTYRETWAPWDNTSHAQYTGLGFILKFNVRFFLPYSRYLCFTAFIQEGSEGIISVSTRFRLSFPRVVPRDTSVFKLACDGNIAAMEALFRLGNAAPSDMLADGTTLLHVSTLVVYRDKTN